MIKISSVPDSVPLSVRGIIKHPYANLDAIYITLHVT